MRSRRPVEASGALEGLITDIMLGCPSCSAQTRLEEGQTSFNCEFCNRSYLMTDEGRAPQFYLEPLIGERDAEQEVRSWLRTNGHRATSIGAGRWVLVPFWRFQGKAFKWFEAERAATSRPGPGTPETFRDLTVRLFDFTHRACELDTGTSTLGSRPDVLTMFPLNARARSWARVLEPTQPIETARDLARNKVDLWTRPGGLDIQCEKFTLVNEQISILYFPFYVVGYQFRDSAHHVVVDGHTGRVSAHADGEDLLRPIDHPQIDTPSTPQGTVVCLPVRCPACSSELANERNDRVRACTRCRRAWEVQGRHVREVRQHVVDNGITPADGRLLPFWSFRIETEGWDAGEPLSHHPFFVPAFDNRHIERLSHLGLHLTRAHPAYSACDAWPSELSGCTVSSADAKRMVWVMLGTISNSEPGSFKQFVENGSLQVIAAELLWVPFRTVGLYLREPVSGALVREVSTRPWRPEEQAAA